MIARLALAVVLAAAPAAQAAEYSPPPWFRDAASVLRDRGATCTVLDERWSASAGEDQHAAGESCTRALPVALGRPFGRSEACWGHAVEVTGAPREPGARRATGESAYLCSILANPGTEAHPNGAGWRCARVLVHHARGARASGAWVADGGRLYAPARFGTLEQCLAPRLILEPARRRASAIAATCSHTCTIRVIVTRRGSNRELARLREPLPFGSPREVPLWLDRPLPRAVTLRVRVASLGVLRRLKLDAAWTGDRLVFAPAVIRVHER